MREKTAVRLAVVTTHPIQYQVPWFRRIAQRKELDLTVLFGSRHGLEQRPDRDFGETFAWDVPMLEGYRSEFLANAAARPSVDEFWGVQTPSMESVLTRDRFDAVLALGWHTRHFWQAFAAADRNRIRLILRGESNLLGPRPFWKSALRRLTLAKTLRQASALLAIGARNRDFYRSHGVPDSKIYDAPYFVDNDWFAEGEREREEARREIGARPGEFIFLFSGKFIPRKRPADLLRAWLSLPEASRESSRVIWVGSGELQGGLEDLARSAPPGKMIFTGFQNQRAIRKFYGAADALVMPSDFGETWGLSANEAMAAGTRVVLSDRVGAAPDLVRPGVTGEVFPCGDLAELRGILQRYVQDARWLQRPEQRSAVRDHIAHFSMDRSTQALLAALRS
ncbi:MAG: glycosyltransferase family 4 protein [Verrucomicrobiae bacterium]|nr:glycosyltransferase family 4 protein [Verrucomicrobiae bacterium]